MEKLQDSTQDEGGAAPIYDAIARGAQALNAHEAANEV